MKIKIQETGEIREIEIIDRHTGKDCIDDVMGLCGESYDTDSDYNAVMPLEIADWWTEYADGRAATATEIDELYEVIDAMPEEAQREILGKFKGSCLSIWDVEEYVYDENRDDLDSQRSIAEIRIQEFRDAIKDCYLDT